MRKVTIFSSVMNTPSILKRKDHGEAVVARIDSVHTRFNFQDTRYMQIGGAGTAVQVIVEQTILMTLSPKKNELIARCKCRNLRKSLFLEGSIVRGKGDSNHG